MPRPNPGTILLLGDKICSENASFLGSMAKIGAYPRRRLQGTRKEGAFYERDGMGEKIGFLRDWLGDHKDGGALAYGELVSIFERFRKRQKEGEREMYTCIKVRIGGIVRIY